jgi:hypothetical protein
VAGTGEGASRGGCEIKRETGGGGSPYRQFYLEVWGQRGCLSYLGSLFPLSSFLWPITKRRSLTLTCAVARTAH